MIDTAKTAVNDPKPTTYLFFSISIFPGFNDFNTINHIIPNAKEEIAIPLNSITVFDATSAATPKEPKNAGIKGESLSIIKKSLDKPNTKETIRTAIIEGLLYLVMK